MIITGVNQIKKSFPLKTPFVTSLRRVDAIEALHFEITTDAGMSGYSAASPTAAITGDTEGSIHEAVFLIVSKLVGKPIDDLNALTNIVSTAIVGNPSAKAAVDVGLYDLFSRVHRLPLVTFLGGSPRELSTDLTISLQDRDTMVANAKKAVDQGFTALKVKLGHEPDHDFERISAISKATQVSLRVDANQGWSVRGALAFMDLCEQHQIPIEFLEQPVHRDDWKGMKTIRERIRCPLVADESVFSPADALRFADSDAADIVNVKLMKCGGISPALRIAAILQTAGLGTMFGCMAESPLGVAAVVHLVSALPAVRYVDLDVPFLLTEIPSNYGFLCVGNRLLAKRECGLVSLS